MTIYGNYVAVSLDTYREDSIFARKICIGITTRQMTEIFGLELPTNTEFFWHEAMDYTKLPLEIEFMAFCWKAYL